MTLAVQVNSIGGQLHSSEERTSQSFGMITIRTRTRVLQFSTETFGKWVQTASKSLKM